MIGPGYWATGITVAWSEGRGWGASLKFFDSGFCDDDAAKGQVSTEGTLTTRYYVGGDGGLAVAIDVLKADAERLGIRWNSVGADPPMLYVEGDGESPDYPMPEGWRDLLAVEARRIGWSTYRTNPVA